MKLNLIAVSLLALTTACIDTAPSDTDSDPGDESPAKIALNSLLPSNLIPSSLGLAKLDPPAMTAFSTTAQQRATLGYIFSCAFSPTSSVTVTVGNVQYTYTGGSQLAQYWAGSPLTVADRQLISACVLSRVNYYGDAISISMRGSSSTLATTQQELTGYILEEGSFYGDILGGTGSAAHIHTCMGASAASEPNEGDLNYRRCTEGATGVGAATYCNFVYDGLCSSVCSTDVGSAGYYDQCNGYTNTVTTFLQD